MTLTQAVGQTRMYSQFGFPVGARSSNIARVITGLPNSGAENIIFFITPKKFVRGELVVADVVSQLRDRNWDGAVAAIVHFNRIHAARQYVRDAHFSFPVLFDSTGDFFKSFGILETAPFITVWDTTGRLLYASSLFGLDTQDPQFWKELTGAHRATPVEQPKLATSLEPHCESTWYPDTSAVVPDVVRRVSLQDDSATALGDVMTFAVDPTERYAAIGDQSSLSLRLFSAVSGAYQGRIDPDLELIFSLSPDVDTTYLKQLMERGIQPMFAAAGFRPDGRLSAVFGVPQFVVDIADGDTNVGVRNYDVLMSGDIDTAFHRRTYTVMDYSRWSPTKPFADFVTFVTDPLTFDPRRGAMIVGMAKGYPVVGSDPRTAVGTNDPRSSDFYATAPLFAAYDASSGELLEAFGQLDSSLYGSYGIGYTLGCGNVAVADDGYVVHEPLKPYLEWGDGDRFKIAPLWNPNFRATNASVPRLQSEEERKCMVDTLGALIKRVAVEGDHVYVLWLVATPGIRLSTGIGHYVLQDYARSSSRLVHTWTIGNTDDDGRLVGQYLEPAAHRWYGIYQWSNSTTIISYNVE